MAEETKEMKPVAGERMVFNIRTIIAIVANVVLVTVWFAKIASRLDNVSQVTIDIKQQQDKAAEESKVRIQAVEAEIAALRVRIAVLESQLQQNQKHEK